MRMNRTKRARKKGRPVKGAPDWKPAWLAAFTRTGNVGASCELAAVARSTVFEAKKKYRTFAAAWEVARATANDALEHEARRRAIKGWDEPVFHQGKPCGFWIDEAGRTYGDKEEKPVGAKFVQVGVRKFSDTLLIFLLKGNRPKKFRENIKHEHGGPNGGAIPLAVTTRVIEDENWYGERNRAHALAAEAASPSIASAVELGQVQGGGVRAPVGQDGNWSANGDAGPRPEPGAEDRGA